MTEFSGEHSKEFFAKIYFARSGVPAYDQTLGITLAVLGFVRCFKETDEEQQIINDLINDPISVILKKYRTNFSDKDFRRLQFKKTLSELDWLFYRDSRYPTKLNKQYFFDADRPSFSKKFFFYDLANILGMVKFYLNEIYSGVASKNKFDFNFDVPIYSGKIQQVEAVIDEHN